MRVLYVTSSIQDVLGFEPADIIGQTALGFLANGDAEEYRTQVGGQQSVEGVLVTKVHARTRSGELIYIKILNFSCDNLAFNVGFAYSEEAAPTRMERGPLRVELVHREPIGGTPALMYGESEQLQSRRHSLLTAHQERNRRQGLGGDGRLVRACLLLEPIGACTDASPMGPRVLFASNSFDRIVSIDTCDVQGMPFLLLVAPEDVARAGQFLDNVKAAATVVVDQFQLLANPLDEQAEGRQARTVAVEIMAAGADSGAVMLCQLRGGLAEEALSDGYMSLEEIISSDPDSSDVGEQWAMQMQ
ncbi:hypothetical protein GGF44_003267 [Coemansia sp. RSA 1694]|nr:hypothetical protein IWW47_002100 [Coemansia sp. RSA 2052]KAJ2635775.1 hypothetical protein GGF44_003267 [Coemansia sp. RSA 1694]